jgi:DNA-binding CsgD family transcriptional regulator/tetratricopeptide (TPR) repeat protein
MRLLERDTQLDGLRAALERARHGQGGTVLVSGEAGIGKTSLLLEFAELIAGRARVFRGSCEDLVTARTLGPFRDMARELVGMTAAGGPAERDALIDALVAEMGFLQRPAVVMVEDAHWADQASLDIIRHLARRVQALPALLVVSYREEDLDADHPFWQVVGSIAGPAALRLELARLSDAAVAELAAAAGVDAGPVTAAAGGNPFFVTELLAAPGAEVPTSVRHAVLARVSGLPRDCREALEGLAVVPTEVRTELVDALLPDPAVLESAERRGILVTSYSGVRFRHELSRRVVEEALPPSRRAALHRRVLDLLVAAGAEPSRLVHHAVAVGDDAAVARYAAAAAREAAVADGHREAAAFAELALDRGQELPAPEAAALHGLAARALYSMNRFGEAAAHADQAVRLWDTDGTTSSGLGAALLISARMSTLLADPAAARAKALRAVEVLAPLGPSRELALGHSTLGSQDALQARFDAAMSTLDDALGLARSVGAQDVVAHALIYRGVSRASLGDEGGLDDLADAVELAGRLDHADYLTVAAHNLAVMLLRAGRVLDAAPHLELAARIAREHRLDTAAFRIEAQQCQVLMLCGDWDAAERRLRALLAAGGDPGANAVNPLAFLGRLLARRGDPTAPGYVARAWELAEATGEDQKQAVAAGARVERLWLAGDDGGVRTVGAQLLDVADRARHLYLRAEVLRYRRRAGEDVEPFRGCPAPFAAGIAGDWATAAELWERAGNPYEQALELTEAPDLAAVGRGLAILDGLGATAAAAVCRRRLRRAGVAGIPRGPRAATRANPGLLTDRQLQVLMLVADGRTNAEIAAQLVVSTRTVDNHVAAVMRRLGVRSRREAIRTAAATGLLGPKPRHSPAAT